MMEDLEPSLQYNPFAGDFGDVWDRCFRDKLVTFRKSGHCSHCSGQVQAKTIGRSLTMYWADDKKVHTYRYCSDCTAAMATSVAKEDHGPIEERCAA
jgi:hypothetical protein